MPATTDALRPRVFIRDRTGATTFHDYNAFSPPSSGIHVQNVAVRLSQSSAGTFSILIEDSENSLDPGVNVGSKVVIQAGKTATGGALPLQNLLTGFVRKKKTIRKHTGALHYLLSGYGSAIRYNERITNFFRIAARDAFGSASPSGADATTKISELFKDLLQDTDHLPVGEPLENIGTSLVGDIPETMPSIREPWVTFAHVANQLADNAGLIWGVDPNEQAFIRSPVAIDSGIHIKDTSSPADDALTCYNVGPWDFEDSMEVADGFANRLFGIGGTQFFVDQSQTVDGGSSTLFGFDRAMKLIPTSRRLDAISLKLHKVGTVTGSLQGQLVLDKNGSPQGGDQLGSFSVFPDLIGTAATNVDRIPLNISQKTIQVDKPLWLILKQIGTNSSNTIFWHHDNLAANINASRTTGNWTVVSSSVGFCFVTYGSRKVLAVNEDGGSINGYGLVEAVLPAPWILEGRTMDRYLAAALQWTSKPKRVFNINEISMPDKLLFPNQLIHITDTKSGLLDHLVEMNSVYYNFDVDKLGLGLNPGPLVQPIEYVGTTPTGGGGEDPPPPPPGANGNFAGGTGNFARGSGNYAP